MTQTIVLHKLKKYLDLLYPIKVKDQAKFASDLKKLIEDPSLLNVFRFFQSTKEPKQSAPLHQDSREALAELKSDLMTKGHCHGLTITRGAMKEVGKVLWWNEVLVLIANWDEKSDSLKKIHHLSEAEDKRGATLESLIERALHYITINQVKSKTHPSNNPFLITHTQLFKPDGYKLEEPPQSKKDEKKLDVELCDVKADTKQVSPQAFKSLNRSYLEVLDTKKTVKYIQSSDFIESLFTKEQLTDLLDEKTVKQHIIFITNHNHIIQIDFKNGEWIIYNANYDHTKLETMEKHFANKAAAIDEVMAILGNQLIVRCLSFNDDKASFAAFKVQHQEPVPVVHDAIWIHLKSYSAPNKVETFINEIKDSPNKKNLLEAIAKIILESVHGTLVLHSLTSHVPKAFLKLLEYIDNSTEGRNLLQAIIAAIPLETGDQTGLYYIAAHSPDGFLMLVQRIVRNDFAAVELFQAIKDALAVTKKNHEGCWLIITEKTPDALLLLVRESLRRQAGEALILSLINSLMEPRTNKESLLYIIAGTSPQTLNEIFTFINSQPEASSRPLVAIIGNTLLKPRNDGYTALHALASCSPTALDDLINLINQRAVYAELVQTLADGLLLENNSPALEQRTSALTYLISNCKPQTVMLLINFSMRTEPAPEKSCCLFTSRPPTAPTRWTNLKNTLLRGFTEKNKQGKTGLELFREKCAANPVFYAEAKQFVESNTPPKAGQVIQVQPRKSTN